MACGSTGTGSHCPPTRSPCGCAAVKCCAPTGRSPRPRSTSPAFDILECDSLEEAIEAAAKHPVATIGAMEVRPFWEDEDPEGEIRRLDAELTDAARAGDVERVVACYARDAEVVSQGDHHRGTEALRKAWEARGPVTREVREFRIHVDESIAFGHALIRTDGNLLRVTTGYRNVGPRWLIVHEHVTETTS